MNPVKNFFLLTLALSFLAPATFAQTLVENEQPLVNQYIFDYNQIKNEAWWNALESQLILMVSKPHDQIDEISMQNLIFFASHHADKMDLRPAVPAIFDMYKHHELEGMRIMAVVAMHAIGDRHGMEQVQRYARQQPEGPARHIAMLALADYY